MGNEREHGLPRETALDARDVDALTSPAGRTTLVAAEEQRAPAGDGTSSPARPPRTTEAAEPRALPSHGLRAWAVAGAAVQRVAATARAPLDPHAVHLRAREGVASSGATIPHAEAIQASFGHHDISGVRAHVGGAAADAADAIGAHAYATGDDVAFAASPDLRQAAHEAAHVVQQRGGVRLDGGVGQVGDPYEQHADAVADRVVRGESAEALLDTMAHRGASGGPAVQGDYHTEPLAAPRAARSEAYDRDAIMTATLEQLFTAYTMAAPADPATPVPLGSTTVQYTWLRGRIGTVVVRGEIRAKLHSATPEQRTAHRAALATLSGDAARIAELTAILDEADHAVGAGGPALLDEAGEVSTFRVRPYRNPARHGEMRTHAASDIGARSGTGVYAPCAGRVIFSAGGAGYGNLVRLLHPAPPPTEIGGTGPLESVYAHLSARLVQVGDEVAAGQAIALTGRSTGNEQGDAGVVPPLSVPEAHLHMAVIRVPAAQATSELAGGRPPGHSSGREVSRGIEPDVWLSQLGASIGAAPVLAMSAGEAATADADGVRRGGVTAVTRWSEGTAAVDGDRALAVARDGVAAASAPLPHRDRIQAAFGRHRVDDVGVAIGGPAADAAHTIGARAYAAGDRIAFASTPSLQVAAHEAAHVVQQRRGDAPDGLGAADHPGERHADAVAAAVTRGESAEALLDRPAGGHASASVQRFGGGDSDTMRAHHDRGELHRGHADVDGPAPSDGAIVHGGADRRAPLDAPALEAQLIQLTERQAAGAPVQMADVRRVLTERATYPDVAAQWTEAITQAGTTSWEAQMTTLEARAPRLWRVVEPRVPHTAVAGTPFPDSRLSAFGTPEQTAFQRAVYNAYVASAQARGREFHMGVADGDLVQVEGGQLRSDAAPHLTALLAQARADLATARAAHDALAIHATTIGVTSAYRSATTELQIWQDLFPDYYAATTSERAAAAGGPHGPAAVQIMVRYYTTRKAAPGFGNHTNGVAIDFTTTQSGVHLGASTSQRTAWRASWLHAWLVAHATSFGFQPLSTEEWHWEYTPH